MAYQFHFKVALRILIPSTYKDDNIENPLIRVCFKFYKTIDSLSFFKHDKC